MQSSTISTSGTDPQVLIVGGGPTGLTLAIELRRYGITCRVIDRDSEEHAHSRGKGIQPRTLEVFDDLGIVDELRSRGMSSGCVRFYTDKQPVAEVVVREIEPRPGIPYPSLLIVPQFETERVLRKRPRDFGVEVERGCELVEFQDDGAQIIANVKHSATGQIEQIRAAYMVGCDGGRSVVRRQLSLRFDGENHDQYWILGDVEIEGLDHDVMAHAWFASDHSYLNATKLPGVNSWQVQASVQPDANGEVEHASLALFQRLFIERTAMPNIRLSNPTWLSNYNVKRRMVDRYRQGRVFVAGDAAHIHSPAGGQGLNTGVQDAYNLGWKLASVLQGNADVTLLDTYEEERLPVARSVLRTSETGNNLFFSTNPVISFFRRFVFLPILKQPRVTAALLLKTAELDLSYRTSSLAQDGKKGRDWHDWFSRRSTPRPGDRAPDARVRDTRTGAPARLFDAFHGPHWTLVVFSGTARNRLDQHRLTTFVEDFSADYGDNVHIYFIQSSAATSSINAGKVKVLADDRNEAHRLYGVQDSALVLVRPDGYVAVRSTLAAPDGLLRYMNTIIEPGRSTVHHAAVLA